MTVKLMRYNEMQTDINKAQTGQVGSDHRTLDLSSRKISPKAIANNHNSMLLLNNVRAAIWPLVKQISNVTLFKSTILFLFLFVQLFV